MANNIELPVKQAARKEISTAPQVLLARPISPAGKRFHASIADTGKLTGRSKPPNKRPVSNI
ncbi:MAG: hypothetical protein ONB44_00325 [candidate division KSB1 bacterium]|nr:hypothetical protein [candidate division KSB1 bacterium]